MSKYQCIAFLIICFIASLAWLHFLLRYAAPDQSDTIAQLGFPTNVQQLKQSAQILSHYTVAHPIYVCVLFCSAYLFKQTFAIPGSVFMNLLAGAIYGIWIGFPLCCLLSAAGATGCYLLSSLVGGTLVEPLLLRCSSSSNNSSTGGRSTLYTSFITLRDTLQGTVQSSSSSSTVTPTTTTTTANNVNRMQMLQLLISLRLFPITPNWLLNIVSPLVGVPLRWFFLSVLLGLMPYNFVCVQTGSLLSELRTIDTLMSMRTFFTLATLALGAAAPSVVFNWKKLLKHFARHTPEVSKD